MNINNIKIKTKSILTSHTFKTVICTVGVLAVIFIIFQLGMIAGFKKSSFGCNWGANYENNFGFNRMGPEMMRGEFGEFSKLPNPHGAIGKIIKVELPSIVVLDDKDKTEKVVIISDNTEIHKMKEDISSDELELDDNIIVIGEPNSSGQIEARLIRLMPSPVMPIKTN